MFDIEKGIDFVGFLNDLSELIRERSGRDITVTALRRAVGVPHSTAYYYDANPGRVPAEVLAVLQDEAGRLGCELEDGEWWRLVKGHLPLDKKLPKGPRRPKKNIKKNG